MKTGEVWLPTMDQNQHILISPTTLNKPPEPDISVPRIKRKPVTN